MTDTKAIDIRVLIADDHADMLDTVRGIINFTPGMTVVGMASSAKEVIKQATMLEPDVVILDVNMPDGGGWEAGRGVRAALPTARLIAYSAYDQALIVRTMRNCGIDGYVRKEADTTLLLAAIRGDAVPEPTPAPGRTLGEGLALRRDAQA